MFFSLLNPSPVFQEDLFLCNCLPVVLVGVGGGEVADLDVVAVQGDAHLGHDLWADMDLFTYRVFE